MRLPIFDLLKNQGENGMAQLKLQGNITCPKVTKYENWSIELSLQQVGDGSLIGEDIGQRYIALSALNQW